MDKLHYHKYSFLSIEYKKHPLAWVFLLFKQTSKPNSVTPQSRGDDHLSRTYVATCLKLPTKFGIALSRCLPARLSPAIAVSSYLTISTLPVLADLGGIFSAALSLYFIKGQKSIEFLFFYFTRLPLGATSNFSVRTFLPPPFMFMSLIIHQYFFQDVF